MASSSNMCRFHAVFALTFLSICHFRFASCDVDARNAVDNFGYRLTRYSIPDINTPSSGSDELHPPPTRATLLTTRSRNRSIAHLFIARRNAIYRFQFDGSNDIIPDVYQTIQNANESETFLSSDDKRSGLNDVVSSHIGNGSGFDDHDVMPVMLVALPPGISTLFNDSVAESEGEIEHQFILNCVQASPSLYLRCFVFDSASEKLEPVYRFDSENDAITRALGLDSESSRNISSPVAFVGSLDDTPKPTSFPLYVASEGRFGGNVLAAITTVKVDFSTPTENGRPVGYRLSTADYRKELFGRSGSPFRIQYADAGFEHGGFVYFVAVQPEAIAPQGQTTPVPLNTRLVRFCRNDSDFQSYSEVLLTCSRPTPPLPPSASRQRPPSNRDGPVYVISGVARVARIVSYVDSPPRRPRRDYGGWSIGQRSPGKNGRHPVFGNADDYSGSSSRSSGGGGVKGDNGRDYKTENLVVLFDVEPTTSSSSGSSTDVGSALCVYPMSDVRAAFVRATKDCYQGIGQLLPWTQRSEDRRCTADISQVKSIDDSYCGHVTNAGGVGSRYAVTTNRVAWYSERHRGTTFQVLGNAVGGIPLGFIGTDQGYVIKVPIYDNKPSSANGIIDVTSVSGVSDNRNRKPNPVTSLLVDNAKNEVYAIISSQIIRLAANSCSLYGDCERCLGSRDRIKCAWCDNKCAPKIECQQIRPFPVYSEYCPPVLLSFHPRIGPSVGGTLLTINGRYFGNDATLVPKDYDVSISVDDRSNSSTDVAAVNIGSANCSIVLRNFSTIVCKTGRVNMSLSREVKVFAENLRKSVKIRGSATSGHDSYEYKEVSVASFLPTVGPRSGGTLLTIDGSNFDVGAESVSVRSVGSPCNIIRIEQTRILCMTSAFNEDWTESDKGSVDVFFNNERVVQHADISNPLLFTYADDPVVFDLKPLSSFRSGGLPLTVFGTNLHVIQAPQILIRAGTTAISEDCVTDLSGKSMTCPSPNISELHHRVDLPSMFEVGFQLDGVNTDSFAFSLQYFDDPVVFNATCPIKVDGKDGFQGTVIDFQGESLDYAAVLDNYNVMVDGDNDRSFCDVTNLTSSNLECVVPKLDHSSFHPTLVKVIVGRLSFPVDLRSCGGSASISPLTLSTAASESTMHPIILSLGGLLTVFLLLVFVISLLFVRRRRWSLGKRRTCHMEPNVLYVASVAPGNAPNLFTDGVLPGGIPVTLPSYEQHGVGRNSYWTRVGDRQRLIDGVARSTLCSYMLDDDTRRLLEDSHLLIPRNRLLVLDAIGQGHFGYVFRGLLKLPGQKAEQDVAVKTLRSLTDGNDESTASAMQKFIDEALTMREFNHDHVLQLLGIVIDGDQSPLVVLPFMTHGDVLSYIRNENNSPSVKDLMNFGIQIAEGMAYLAGLKFVHRDLAARNCMLDEELRVKVADFGLSRDIYEHDYYSSDDRKAKLPVKWMALESLEKGVYSTKTDIWSYGVVLWELITRGVCPYPDVDNWDIVRYLKSGRRMPQPSYCPEQLYGLMLRCWEVDPTRRPNFAELATSISAIITEMQAAAEGQVSLGATYYINFAASIATVDDLDYLSPKEQASCSSLAIDDDLTSCHADNNDDGDFISMETLALRPVTGSDEATDGVAEEQETST